MKSKPFVLKKELVYMTLDDILFDCIHRLSSFPFMLRRVHCYWTARKIGFTHIYS